MNNIKRDPTIFIPDDLENSEYVGDLFGFFHSEENVYNVLAWDVESRTNYKNLPLEKIGSIITTTNHSANDEGVDVLGVRTEQGLEFSTGETQYTKVIFSLTQNIFSRNTGILETNYMLEKTAFIFGCGSVGSLVALELAKAGVGNFVLVDNDIFNYHNICRHQCGIQDVGRFKVHALKDRISWINPSANVVPLVSIAEDLNKDDFDKYCKSGAILVGCADNREADNYISRIASIYNVPFVSIGFWERAFAGEVFYYIPSENMPCYECAIGLVPESTSRVSTNRRIYSTEENIEDVNFEPGISIDINFVTLVALKIILDILNRSNPEFTPRVIDHLTQFTLICNTDNPKIGGEMAEIFAQPLQITNSIKVEYNGTCPPCKYR